MHILYLSENLIETLGSIKALPSSGYIWINATPSELNEVLTTITLLTDVTIDENHIADACNEEHPASHENGLGYELLAVRHLIAIDKDFDFKTQLVSFFILDRLLVTISQSEPTLNSIFEQVQSAKNRSSRAPDGLVHFLLNKIVDQYLKVRPEITEKQIYWQKMLLTRKKNFNAWGELFTYRNNIAHLAILCEVQQDAIEMWTQNMDEATFNRMAVRLNDLKSHNSRILSFAKKTEDEIAALMQLHYAIVGHRTNEIIRILAIVSSIFMPLSFMTGVFGMNFVNMPILHWQDGFHATLIFMVMLAVILLVFFKFKKWV